MNTNEVETIPASFLIRKTLTDASIIAWVIRLYAPTIELYQISFADSVSVCRGSLHRARRLNTSDEHLKYFVARTLAEFLANVGPTTVRDQL